MGGLLMWGGRIALQICHETQPSTDSALYQGKGALPKITCHYTPTIEHCQAPASAEAATLEQDFASEHTVL